MPPDITDLSNINRGSAFKDLGRQSPRERLPNDRLRDSDSIYRPFANAALQAARCQDCGINYCAVGHPDTSKSQAAGGCPLGNDIPHWLDLYFQFKLTNNEQLLFAAADSVATTNMLGEMCGTLCPQDILCEGNCTHGDEERSSMNDLPDYVNESLEGVDLNGSVVIGANEAGIITEALAAGWMPPHQKESVPLKGKRVAIIGAGPMGMASALQLKAHGVETVDVFDKADEIGGLLMYGIPNFKLEKQVVWTRRKSMEAIDINFELNQEIDTPRFKELLQDYDAIIIGTGAPVPITGDLNMNIKEVHLAVPYLDASIRHQYPEKLSKGPAYKDLKDRRVVVLGGGDTGIDCVRTAQRQGASSVTLVHRGASLRAGNREQKNATDEGIKFELELQPIEFLSDNNGKLTGVRCQKIEFIEGISKNTGQEIIIPADDVIVAFGFKKQVPQWMIDTGIASQNELFSDDAARIKGLTQHASGKVFAGGDVARGAALVVHSVLDARESVDHGVIPLLLSHNNDEIA